jgi:hypothetical protein
MPFQEVFNRLLVLPGSTNGTGAGDDEGGAGTNSTYGSPITPADLLVALHTVDPNKVDMKTVIKATNMCFQERQVYSQEVIVRG